MEKYLQAKKKNHYVWEKYLQNWAVDGQVYWVTPKTKKVVLDSTKGMCMEPNFYKISPLDSVDVMYLKEWTSKSPKHLQELHENLINTFIEVSAILKMYEDSNSKDPLFEKASKALQHNCIENLYCGVENGARHAIEKLANGDISVIDNESHLIGLYSYLGHQITRTKAIKDRFIRSLNNSCSSEIEKSILCLTEKNWWLLSYILGTNIGWSLYESRKRDELFIVKNMSEQSFITSDCPVINVHPERDNTIKGGQVNFLDIYFPLSPEYSLMVCESRQWSYLSNGASLSDVENLNLRIAGNSNISIFGISEEVVKSNKHKVGAW